MWNLSQIARKATIEGRSRRIEFGRDALGGRVLSSLLRMAIVTRFREVVKDRVGRAKPTECGYAFVELDGVEYLLIESYGSSERSKPGKISQSLHLDRNRAGELKPLLERRFPGI
jgi:hypothetical protein